MMPVPLASNLRDAIDKVILVVPFDQNCGCGRCIAMRELQQAALATVETSTRRCGKCNQDVTEGWGCNYVACPYPLPPKTSRDGTTPHVLPTITKPPQ